MRSAEARRFLEVYIANPETGARVPSLMVGEVGIRAVANLDHYRSASESSSPAHRAREV